MPRPKRRNDNPEAVEFSKKLRRELSGSEKKLWQQLRRNGRGYKFVRQYRVGPYFLDFYCPQLQFAIEVDGERHSERAGKDADRDDYLAVRHILVLRIPSLELWGENHENVTSWASKIEEICWAREVALGDRSPTPNPSPFGSAKGGGEPECR